MTEGIIVGILSLIGTLAGTYFANRKSSALIAYRLELLEKKVDKHNSSRGTNLQTGRTGRPLLKKKSRSRITV